MGNDPKAERHQPWSDAQQDMNWEPSLTGHVIFSFRFWPTVACRRLGALGPYQLYALLQSGQWPSAVSVGHSSLRCGNSCFS